LNILTEKVEKNYYIRMRAISAQCNVFEKTKELKPQKYARSIDRENLIFLKMLKDSARGDLLDLQYTVHPLPGTIAEGDPPPECMPELAEPRYDADFAICLYPDISKVGPEIGYLIHRRKKELRHLFIVTERYTPDEMSYYKGLRCITPHAEKTDGAVFFPESLFADASERDAIDTHILSFWPLRSIRNPDTRLKILTILSTR
jgi:hypothetical protein